MNRKQVVALLVAVSIYTAAGRVSAADQWIEIKSPHFTVVTNNGERSARNVAWQFEQVRAAMQQAWPWSRVDLDRPFLVIGVKDENTMKLFAPKYWEAGNAAHPSSVSASGGSAHYVTMRADLTTDGPEGVNPYSDSYWAYANLTLTSSYRNQLPVWFTRGLSSVLSNTNVTDKEVQFGRALRSYIQEFSGGRYGLPELLAVERSSPIFQREVEWQRFDAQAWGLLHYMLFASPDAQERDAKINTLARALLSGTSSAEAVQQVYGPLPALDLAYRQYVTRGMFRYVQMKADLKVVAKDFGLKPIAPADVLAIRATYHVATNRPVEARQAIADARKLVPQLAATYDAEGLLADRESKPEEARAAYAKAVEFGSTDFHSYVRLVNLTQRGGATPESLANMRTWLTKAIELNPTNAVGYQSLSTVLLQMNLPADALAPARKAVELDAQDFNTHLTLANVLQRSGQKDEALKEARAALALAVTDTERRYAQSVIDAIQR
jgi:tetratricopeptide (TPR) repeat protein